MILCVTASLHVFNHIVIHLKKKSSPLLDQIEKWTLLSTIDYMRLQSRKKKLMLDAHTAKFNFNRTFFSFLYFNSLLIAELHASVKPYS